MKKKSILSAFDIGSCSAMLNVEIMIDHEKLVFYFHVSFFCLFGWLVFFFCLVGFFGGVHVCLVTFGDFLKISCLE